MDFELSARYRVTGNFVGLPAFGPFDMTYLGERAQGGTDFHLFIEADDRFQLGIPDHLIGSDFLVEPM